MLTVLTMNWSATRKKRARKIPMPMVTLMVPSTGAARLASDALSAAGRPTAKSNHTRTGTRWYGYTRNAAGTGSRSTRNRISASVELGGVAGTDLLARLVSKHQPPGVQRRRVDVDGVAVIVIPGRHA